MSRISYRKAPWSRPTNRSSSAVPGRLSYVATALAAAALIVSEFADQKIAAVELNVRSEPAAAVITTQRAEA